MAKLIDCCDYVFGNEIEGYDPNNEAHGTLPGGINYTDDPNDRGAATCFGVSQQVWNQYFGRAVSPEEIQGMSKYDALAVMFKLYWLPARLDQIKNAQIATALLDTYWGNPGGTIKMAQQICNILGQNITIDNVIGPQTIGAINSVNPNAFIAQLSVMVAARYKDIVASDPSQQVFLSGWLARAERLKMLMTPMSDPGLVS